MFYRSILIVLITFSTYIVYRKEVALKLALVSLVFIVLMFVSDQYLHSKYLAVSFLILLFLPLLFIKAVLNHFTRKVIIQFDEEEISFNITKVDSDTDSYSLTYKLSDIVSYQVQFPNSRFACLVLLLVSGEKKEFSFCRYTFRDKKSNAVTVVESIYKAFAQRHIGFAPSFYASQKGLYTIIILLILLCIPFGIAIYQNKNLPATLIGSALLIGHVTIRRMTDLRFYEKWKQLG